MPSIRSILVYGLSVLSSVSAQSNKDQCENHGLDTAYQRGTGKIGGTPFCASKIRQGKVITGIECWADRDSVRGLRFFYSDTSKEMYGKSDGLNGRVVNLRLDWDPIKDSFEHLKLWDNGWNQVIGRIYMELKNGKKLDCGRNAEFGPPSVEVDTGASGMMIAAEGGHGDAIDYIKFQFTKTAASRVDLKDLSIPALNSAQGLQSGAFKTLRIINRQDNDTLETEAFEFREKMQTRRHWTFSETNTFGFGQSFGINVGIPQGGIETNTELKWEKTTATTQDNVDGYLDEMSWGIKALTIKPGWAKVIDIRTIRGELKDAPYQAKMEVTFKDGKTFTYDTIASLGVIKHTKMNTIIKDEPVEDALKAIGAGASEYSPEGKGMSKDESQKKQKEEEDKKRQKEEEDKKKQKEEEDKKKQKEEEEKKKKKPEESDEEKTPKEDDKKSDSSEAKEPEGDESKDTKEDDEQEETEEDDGDDNFVDENDDSEFVDDELEKRRAIPFQA